MIEIFGVYCVIEILDVYYVFEIFDVYYMFEIFDFYYVFEIFEIHIWLPINQNIAHREAIKLVLTRGNKEIQEETSSQAPSYASPSPQL